MKKLKGLFLALLLVCGLGMATIYAEDTSNVTFTMLTGRTTYKNPKKIKEEYTIVNQTGSTMENVSILVDCPSGFVVSEVGNPVSVDNVENGATSVQTIYLEKASLPTQVIESVKTSVSTHTVLWICIMVGAVVILVILFILKGKGKNKKMFSILLALSLGASVVPVSQSEVNAASTTQTATTSTVVTIDGSEVTLSATLTYDIPVQEEQSTTDDTTQTTVSITSADYIGTYCIENSTSGDYINISSIENGQVEFDIYKLDENQNIICDSGKITAAIAVNQANFTWKDTCNNEGTGVLTFNAAHDLTLALDQTVAAEGSSASLAIGTNHFVLYEESASQSSENTEEKTTEESTSTEKQDETTTDQSTTTEKQDETVTDESSKTEAQEEKTTDSSSKTETTDEKTSEETSSTDEKEKSEKEETTKEDTTKEETSTESQETTAETTKEDNLLLALECYKNDDLDGANSYNALMKKYAEEDCVKDMSKKEKSAYLKKVKEFNTTDATSEMYLRAYYLTDYDNDGKAELLVDYGKDEADAVVEIYKYQKDDDSVTSLGKLGSGHTVFYPWKDHEGVIAHYCQQGYETFSYRYLKDDIDTSEEICSKEVETYFELNNQLDPHYTLDENDKVVWSYDDLK